jgi:hypothetical protein
MSFVFRHAHLHHHHRHTSGPAALRAMSSIR